MVMLAAQVFVAGEESERRRPKARVLTLIGVLPGLAGERGGGAVICTVIEVVKSGPTTCPSRRCSAASIWKFQADGMQNIPGPVLYFYFLCGGNHRSAAAFLLQGTIAQDFPPLVCQSINFVSALLSYLRFF